MSTTYGTDAGLIYIDDEDDDDPQEAGSRRDRLRPRGRARSRQARRLEPDRDPRRHPRRRSPEQVESEFEGEGYGAFKQAVAEDVVKLLAPVRDRYRELRPDEGGLERTLAEGAERARAIAEPVMAEVRDAMGIGPRAVGRRG